jgi:hypothetical protein
MDFRRKPIIQHALWNALNAVSHVYYRYPRFHQIWAYSSSHVRLKELLAASRNVAKCLSQPTSIERNKPKA